MLKNIIRCGCPGFDGGGNIDRYFQFISTLIPLIYVYVTLGRRDDQFAS